ncbi:hypothetical protein [Cohnella herbarum]|uniref:Uncharacterized protein n=1 Tax=Cohnella herbarum TaxID=2728023 RepID=A0A7Z2ZQ63_9BACL|nr:hypothetical protein [Cohnella herbarum]QJD87889.1 hypothetical protein HH215_34995 [Cohnella herbarum]
MIIISEYKDLLGELETLEWMLDNVNRQFMQNRADMHGHKIPFIKTIARQDNLVERVRELEREIGEKKTLIRRIEEKFKNFTGLSYVVFYKRDIENKSLQIIADELGYSYDHIKRISRKTSMKSEK